MSEEKIRMVSKMFAEEAKKLYGNKLQNVILYGSCARGDYQADSDIDIMLLLNVERDSLAEERKKIFAIADRIDLAYDVVLAPVLQSVDVFHNYLPVSAFYQNVLKEGIRIV